MAKEMTDQARQLAERDAIRDQYAGTPGVGGQVEELVNRHALAGHYGRDEEQAALAAQLDEMGYTPMTTRKQAAAARRAAAEPDTAASNTDRADSGGKDDGGKAGDAKPADDTHAGSAQPGDGRPGDPALADDRDDPKHKPPAGRSRGAGRDRT